MFKAKAAKQLSAMEGSNFSRSRASTLTPSSSSLSDMEKESTLSSSATSYLEALSDVIQSNPQTHRPRTAPTVEPQNDEKHAVPAGDETEYPVGMKLGLVVLALCLSVFVMALDNSIIATAIPRITDEFNSLSDVGWYGSAYLLTTASLQLSFGKLYTFFSIKWIYLCAIALFELGSVICGVAPSSICLILGRAIAGLGGAGIYSGSLVILAYSVPLSKRPIYGSFVSSMWGIASVAGPLLGGLFTDSLTWRWCFYINLPIGAITVAVIVLFFHDPVRKIPQETWRTRFLQVDPLGNLVFMPAVICLMLALHWGGVTHAWSSPRIVVLFIICGLAMAAFLYLQHRGQENATVPPRIFRKRSVWSSSLYAFCLGAAYLTSVYFLPIWFQAVRGASAVDSGVMNLPMLVGVVVFSLIAGALVSFWGFYAPWMILGSVLMAVGYALISTFNPSTPSSLWIGYQIIASAGVGVGMQQPLMAVQVVLDMADVPTGTSIIIFMQTVGGAVFVAIGQMAFTNSLVEGMVRHVPGLDPHAVIASGVTAIRKAVSPDLLPGIAQAYSNALAKAFLVCAVAACATIIGAIFVEWKSVKGKKVQTPVA